jgi:flagellin-like hook-associated protein FlgL
MKWPWEKILHISQFAMTVLLLASTIFLLVQTIILTGWTYHSSQVTDQIATDTQASRQSLTNTEKNISDLATGLVGEDSLLINQLTEIRSDTKATKGALVAEDGIKDSIDSIKSDIGSIEEDVRSIEKQVADIKDLL